MADLRMQLAAYVEATIERVDVEDVLAARTVLPQPAWARPIWRRPVVVALAAAVAVIILIGGAALLSIWLVDRGPVATTTTTTTFPTSLALIHPQEKTPFPGQGANLNDVAAGESLVVAVGEARSTAANMMPDGLVVISADGLDWERVYDSEDLLLGYKFLNTVIAGGPGFVMGGSSCDTPERCQGMIAALWTSVDGRDWVRVPHDAALLGIRGNITDLLVYGSEILALGQVCDGETWETCGWVVLVSPDGRTWERAWKSSVAWANRFTVGPAGLVAAAEDNAGANNFAAAWTSVDGRVWQRVAHDPAVFGDGLAYTEPMGAIAGGVPGYVSLGGNGVDYVGWFSPDGVDWERIPYDAGLFGESRMNCVVAWGDGFAAGGPPVAWDEGAVPTRPTLWASPDGRSWRRIPFGAADAVGTVNGLAEYRGMLIAVGQDGDFWLGEDAVWVGGGPAAGASD